MNPSEVDDLFDILEEWEAHLSSDLETAQYLRLLEDGDELELGGAQLSKHGPSDQDGRVSSSSLTRPTPSRGLGS